MSNELLECTLNAMLKALEKKNLSMINIFSNRLISDSVFLENIEYNTCGITIKNILELLNELENNFIDDEEKTKKIYDYINNYILRFKQLIGESLKESGIKSPLKILWAEYYKLWEELLGLLLKSDIYEDCYKQNTEYSRKVIVLMIENLLNDWKQFNFKNRFFINGICSEIERISKNFMIEIDEFQLYNYLTMLERIIDVIIYENINDIYKISDNNEISETISKEISNYLDFIKLYLEDKDKFIEEMDLKLFSISKKWRFSYLKYMDVQKSLLPQLVKKKKKVIDIPVDVKAKIDDLVKNSLYNNPKK